MARRQTEAAGCDECEDGTVRPFGPHEYVCGMCDAQMSSSRFEAAKDE